MAKPNKRKAPLHRALAPPRFNPDAPFAEGVRGQERFWIQDGYVFDQPDGRFRGALHG
jgi:hypothetical protein